MHYAVQCAATTTQIELLSSLIPAGYAGRCLATFGFGQISKIRIWYISGLEM